MTFVMKLWKDRESLKICVEATRLNVLFRTETISKLRQSQKLSKSPKTVWISKLTQSQSCANLKTEMPRPFFRNVFPRLVTCRTAIAKLDRGQNNQQIPMIMSMVIIKCRSVFWQNHNKQLTFQNLEILLRTWLISSSKKGCRCDGCDR